MSFGKYMRNGLGGGAAVSLARFEALLVNPELWGSLRWAVLFSFCHLIVTVLTGICNIFGPSCLDVNFPPVECGGARFTYTPMAGKQCDSILLPATNGITNFVRLEAYSNLRNKDICGHNGTSRFKRFNFRRATGNFGLPDVRPMNLMKSNPVDAHFPVLTGINYRLVFFLLA